VNKVIHSSFPITFIMKCDSTNYEAFFMTLLIGNRSIFELSVLAELKKLILLSTVTILKLEYLNRLNASSMICLWDLEVSFTSEYAVGQGNIFCLEGSYFISRRPS
jgi:hypothetical protein